MKTVKERAQALLTLVETLVETPGLTWVDASNAVFYPGGPFTRLFTTKADRVAFRKCKEGQRLDELIANLPEPPVRPGVEILDSKYMIPIPTGSKRRSLPKGKRKAGV